MSTKRSAPRPLSLVIAAVGTGLAALFTATMSLLSATSRHGWFSAGVATWLGAWALAAAVSAWLLWRMNPWSRGPAAAIGLMHLFAYGQIALDSQPLAWLAVVVIAASVVALFWPTTTEALGLGGKLDDD